jgi:DNA polymerase III subunit epsilon
LEKAYNARLLKAFHYYFFDKSDFLIIESGNDRNSKYAIQVENHVYKGFGSFNTEYTGNEYERIEECIVPHIHENEVIKMIKTHLKKDRRYQILEN